MNVNTLPEYATSMDGCQLEEELRKPHVLNNDDLFSLSTQSANKDRPTGVGLFPANWHLLGEFKDHTHGM